jgi:hypothetical protein
MFQMQRDSADLKSSRSAASKQSALVDVGRRRRKRAFACGPTNMKKKEMAMKTAVMKFMTAVSLLAALTLTLPGASFAQNRGNTCIPHYDSSGAQTAPYC